MLQRISRFWLRRVYPDLVTLTAAIGTAGLVGCVLLLLLLAKLSREILEKESFAFDRSFLLWLHQFATPGLDRLMLNLTQLGNPEVVIPIAALTLIILWIRRWRSEAKLFAIACVGSAILNTGLKLVFTRTRPDLWKRLIVETSYSFPSGHALGSVVLYGIIAYFLAQAYPKYAALYYSGAIGLVFAISLSRLYLGVHWLTDILAGWSIGLLWLTVCVTMLKLQRMSRDKVAASQ
jgi:membrane-associated phospholipid phosphatase